MSYGTPISSQYQANLSLKTDLFVCLFWLFWDTVPRTPKRLVRCSYEYFSLRLWSRTSCLRVSWSFIARAWGVVAEETKHFLAFWVLPHVKSNQRHYKITSLQCAEPSFASTYLGMPWSNMGAGAFVLRHSTAKLHQRSQQWSRRREFSTASMCMSQFWSCRCLVVKGVNFRWLIYHKIWRTP